jgi:hypothetical protein
MTAGVGDWEKLLSDGRQTVFHDSVSVTICWKEASYVVSAEVIKFVRWWSNKHFT